MTMMRPGFLIAGTCLAIIAGCASPSTRTDESAAAMKNLEEARSSHLSTVQRAELYLQAAATSAPFLASGTAQTTTRQTYNSAASELTVLLRSADGGRLWNHAETVTNDGVTYHLRFQPGVHDQVWPPDFFTSFTREHEVKKNRIHNVNQRDGVGGELVGVRQPSKLDPFMLPRGVMNLPVTATLDFHGRNAVLALQDPRNQPTVRVQGRERPLAADFSAPLAAYKPVSELWTGLMGALRAERYMGKTGLYFLQPYDPNRIPVIFVHGLISTPQVWLNVVNELNADPVLRARYQYWVFAYPTGNPMAYSAMRLREDMAKVQQTYPDHHRYVLVGHSMGGLVSQMQSTTINRDAWVRNMGEHTGQILGGLPPGNSLRSMFLFDANPEVARIVFICTPHRGSNMAIQSIGQLAMRLIALPSSLAGALNKTLSGEISTYTGSKGLPNSIFSLSPKNPMLHLLDNQPIQAPYHSIIGDRGKGDTPNSTDGIVAYWSSHLEGAQSELIVPGPHGSCELPQTIAELRRILHLNLETAGQQHKP
jgi:pimeloyl-ACP methyl ester carboxylesterase